MAVITISRQVGSEGDRIARGVCELLGYRYLDKALMAQVAQEQGISEEEAIDFSEDSYHVRSVVDTLLRRPPSPSGASTWNRATRGEEARLARVVDQEMAAALVSATVRALWRYGQIVVVGRGGQAILRDAPGVLHVRIVARLEDRVRRLMESAALDRKAALGLIDERDRATTQYLRRFHDVAWSDPTLYHLVVNSSLLDVEPAAEVIAAAAERIGGS